MLARCFLAGDGYSASRSGCREWVALNRPSMSSLKYLLFVIALMAGPQSRAQLVPAPQPESQAAHREAGLPAASAQDGTRPWTFIVAPLILHWEPVPEHRYSIAFALEYADKSDNSLMGFSLFRNSFGQPSAYAYLGKRWDGIWDTPDLSFKLTYGLLYGYVDKYKDRVPLNHNGFSPGLVPILLYRLDRDRSIDLMVLGVGGVGFSYSYNF